MKHIRTLQSLLIGSCLAWVSCEKKHPLRADSADGRCIFHCTQKERSFKTGKYGGWIFADSEPDWVAGSAHVEIDGTTYKLPSRLVSKIANPQSIAFHKVERVSAKQIDIFLHGGDGAGGMLLELNFDGSNLVKAQAHTVASNDPWVVYP